MKKYEIMYILKADLDDANRNELIGKLNNILTVDEEPSIMSTNGD